MGHSLRYAVNCSILFTELPLLERAGAAARAGFRAVEFWWPFDTSVPGDEQVDEFVASVRDAGVAVVGLNFAAGDMPAGDRGLTSWVGREQEFQDSTAVTVGIAEQLGCPQFNVLYGNRQPDSTPEQQDELAVANYAFAAEAVARIGGRILVEPVSGIDSYPLKTAADVLAVIDRVQQFSGAENIGLLADLYHLAVNGDDVDKVIAEHTGRIAHVQLADSPGRGEPGTGKLPLERQVEDLEARGYRGWVALEYKPSSTTGESLERLPRERRALGA
ncbi:hydroxypyruvate isomerase family protein [Nocardia sp. NPDC020380]|uniref:hydroxypyruvate isomerase family protein n=1 Tax=Nocardia sp. NPDC020380 TaxID=3364309 RepID=UPI0037933542